MAKSKDRRLAVDLDKEKCKIFFTFLDVFLKMNRGRGVKSVEESSRGRRIKNLSPRAPKLKIADIQMGLGASRCVNLNIIESCREKEDAFIIVFQPGTDFEEQEKTLLFENKDLSVSAIFPKDEVLKVYDYHSRKVFFKKGA